jgi:hypothetical protein
MELKENKIILSYEGLQSLMSKYIDHLTFHNQSTKLKELLFSMHRDNDSSGQGLKPMLDFMSKHGMPHQFPKDGSHFNQLEAFRCGPNFTSLSEIHLIRATEYW